MQKEYELFIYWGVRLGTLDPESKTITKVCSEMYFKGWSLEIQMKRGFVIVFLSEHNANAKEAAASFFEIFKTKKVPSGYNPILHDLECELRLKDSTSLVWEYHQRSKPASYISQR